MRAKRQSLLPSVIFWTLALILPCVASVLPADEEQSNQCKNQLEQIGLAFRIWAVDNEDHYPFRVPVSNGGSMDFRRLYGNQAFDLNSFRHFQIMSNALYAPKILVCPSDTNRQPAVNFQTLRSENVTYQLCTGTNVTEDNAQEILACCPIHGNVLFCDYSVQVYKLDDSSLTRVNQFLQEGKGEDATDLAKVLLIANPDNPYIPKLREILSDANIADPATAGIITDSELAKVMQLIQGDQKAEARSMIAQLLADKPNDPNVPKLRKLLDSLGHSNSNTTRGQRSSSDINGPSERETLEWIQSHLPQLASYVASLSFQMSIDSKVKSVEVKDGRITIVEMSSVLNARRGGGSNGSATRLEGNLHDFIGNIEISRKTSQSGWTPEIRTALRFTSKPNKIKRVVSQFSKPNVGKYEIDRVEVDWHTDIEAEVVRRVQSGRGKTDSDSQFEISVDPEWAERFKKAFDHLIKLNGGGEEEAF